MMIWNMMNFAGIVLWDYIMSEDLEKEFPSGGTHIGVWSGLADVAYVILATVEADVNVINWSLY